MILHCARRTSTFRAGAFCEHRGFLERPSSFISMFPSLSSTFPLSRVAWIGPTPRALNEHRFIVRVQRAKGTIQVALPRP